MRWIDFAGGRPALLQQSLLLLRVLDLELDRGLIRRLEIAEEFAAPA